MTVEEQRLAVWEAFGGVASPTVTQSCTIPIKWNGEKKYLNIEIPPLDSNTAHEAESLLRAFDKIWPEYFEYLAVKLCNNKVSEAIIAPPEKRIQAFLLTIGKWKDDTSSKNFRHSKDLSGQDGDRDS